MNHEITRRRLEAQPVLVVRRRIDRSQIAATIAESLGRIFQYAQQHGIALTGMPFARYTDVSGGMLTIEPGMRLAAAIAPAAPGAQDGDVVGDVLPAGDAAVTLHVGPYDTLVQAYAALESWIDANGVQRAGAPWESYITDPATVPNPAEWKTEVSWPIA